MPFEIVQRPGGGLTNPTTVGVHWTKESHVQLHVEREHLLECRHASEHIDWKPVEGLTPKTQEVFGRSMCSDCPPHEDQTLPVGTVRCGDSQIAYKTDTDRVDNCWTILRLSGSVEHATNEQVVNLPVVAMPESGAVPAAEIWTEVLDRGALNRMIRTLRKARDDAYGADA